MSNVAKRRILSAVTAITIVEARRRLDAAAAAYFAACSTIGYAPDELAALADAGFEFGQVVERTTGPANVAPIAAARSRVFSSCDSLTLPGQCAGWPA